MMTPKKFGGRASDFALSVPPHDPACLWLRKSLDANMSFSLSAKKGPKLAFDIKGQQKASKPAAFAADSDDEEDVGLQQESKRQRRSFTG